MSERKTVAADALDFTSPGRRDYFVELEHPSIWGHYLIPLTVFVGPKADSGRGLLAIGATHGNEYEGPIALKHLLAAGEIRAQDILGRIIVVPVLNVPAFRAGRRDTPDDGANLNRAFPGLAAGSITQRIAYFVVNRLFPQAHVVIDLHAGGQVARFAPCTSFHYVADAKQQKQMQDVARGFGVPFVMIYQDKTPGLLTSTAERMGKISVGGEFGWGEGVSREGVSMCRQGVLAAAIAHGQLRGEPPKNLHTPAERQQLIDNNERDCYMTARRDGFFEPAADLGVHVKKGDRVAWLHDFDGDLCGAIEMLAPHDGIVSALAWGAKVVQGQSVVVVSRAKEWFT
jgi:predicted deacylase